MNRRRFISLSLAEVRHLAYGSVANESSASAEQAEINLGSESLGRVLVHFAGLSYEMVQLCLQEASAMLRRYNGKSHCFLRSERW